MQKLSVILVVLDKNSLEEAIASLNFDNAQLEAVVVEGGDNSCVRYGDFKLYLYSFASIEKFFKRGSEYIWLLTGSGADAGKVWRMAKLLLGSGVPKDNIVNFIVAPHLSQPWLANLRYVEKYPVDVIATGISYTAVGLDLERITGMRGVNLASSNQDLRQAFLTAQYVFEHRQSIQSQSIQPRSDELRASGAQSIKVVLIGLAPYSFRYENLESFSVCSRNLQYLLALRNSRDDSVHGQLLRMLVSNQIMQAFLSMTAEEADPNFSDLKTIVNREMKPSTFVDWEAELDNLTKKFRAETFEKNLATLEQYIQLCLAHGAKPVGVIFPFAPIINRKYPRDLLATFRRTLRQLEKAYDFHVIDLFDLPLGYKNFYNMSHLNVAGARMSSILINYELFTRGLKSIESMLPTKYDDLYELAYMISPKKFNVLLDDCFKLSIENIRRKERIKVGFVLYDASMWCGDDVYNFFERAERYEPVIVFCRRNDLDNELIAEEFARGLESFRSKNMNVVAVASEDQIPKQDVLIYLTPYTDALPKQFRLDAQSVETLTCYVPYGMHITHEFRDIIVNCPLVLTAWKTFLDTNSTFEYFRQNNRSGLPRGYYSGHPKLDVFADDSDGHFDWKMTRPDAKKIIWAPHWSIDDGVKFSTFQWNFEFMYEYAAAHPEISWVVKPHPNLMFSAVQSKLFESDAAFEQYLERWNELPNARVVTGGYYYDLFKTSDGMILDSCSFIVEYQYAHKPMIFLTRETQDFNELTGALVELLYRVDGRDHDGIARLIQDVFVDGNDPKAGARREFFDRNLNYVKDNGVTASEFIFREIDRELGR